MAPYFQQFSSAQNGLSSTGVVLCNFALAIFLAICAYTDGTRAKIYNKVTFPAMLAGLLLHGIFGGAQSLIYSALGLAVGFGIQFVPWMLGLAKAGDVKLLMAVGALKGWAFCCFGFLYGALAFGLISIPWLLKRGELKAVGQNLKGYAQIAMMTQSAPDAPTPTVTKKFVPWGVGLSLGFFVALGLEMILGKAFWFTF
ncbi:prepilin peptidase CpaA [Abditibacterium utsteinense]|uniref:Prepilin peptidase CpaA n=1 Tax=Abditibacterium utsteinense TaxID=1960156 RepID=A0A2S8SVV1_9BACT|nr:A24 family peptidase [Abditibacterium utsteinense]PQV64913.1 prepilin peptidase CpaA [Abditibacterium utsteinense]